MVSAHVHVRDQTALMVERVVTHLTFEPFRLVPCVCWDLECSCLIGRDFHLLCFVGGDFRLLCVGRDFELFRLWGGDFDGGRGFGRDAYAVEQQRHS